MSNILRDYYLLLCKLLWQIPMQIDSTHFERFASFREHFVIIDYKFLKVVIFSPSLTPTSPFLFKDFPHIA